MAEMRLCEDIVAVVGGNRRRLDGMRRKVSGCYWLVDGWVLILACRRLEYFEDEVVL